MSHIPAAPGPAGRVPADEGYEYILRGYERLHSTDAWEAWPLCALAKEYPGLTRDKLGAQLHNTIILQYSCCQRSRSTVPVARQTAGIKLESAEFAYMPRGSRQSTDFVLAPKIQFLGFNQLRCRNVISATAIHIFLYAWIQYPQCLEPIRVPVKEFAMGLRWI